MARYVSLHALGCLPRSGFAALCAQLFASSGARVIRVLAGQIAEKLMVEFEADDRQTAEHWLEQRHLKAQWLMRVDLLSTDGTVEEC